MEGIGGQTYSPSIDEVSDEGAGITEWIEACRLSGKTIVSAFTSSPDENIGIELAYNHENLDLSHLGESIFFDQDTWLTALIACFKELVRDACLIIRVHPRMAKDKRGLPESPRLKEYIKTINEAIGNCDYIRVVLPESTVSSYKLGLMSDIILNGWSTIGLEFAIMGKRVSNAFYKCAKGSAALYPIHLNTAPLKSVKEYKHRILELLDNKRDDCFSSNVLVGHDEAAKAFIAYFMCGLVDLSDDSALRSQLASPVLLTPLLCKFLSRDDT